MKRERKKIEKQRETDLLYIVSFDSEKNSTWGTEERRNNRRKESVD